MKTGSYVSWCILLTSIIAAALFPIGGTGASAGIGPDTAFFPDVQGHWASLAIARWAELDVIQGDTRGFRPDDPITMAEMAVLLDNLLGFTALSEAPPSNASTEPWYEGALRAAELAGLVDKEALGRIAPKDPLTREKAAVLLARALGVEENAGNETGFKDAGQIDWRNQLLIFGIEADGYMKGAADRCFAPKALATRAQVITIIDRAVRAFYSSAGVFTKSVKPADGIANCVSIVRVRGVTLKGMAVYGDLIIAEGLKNGEFTLENSSVSGNLVIRSGAGTAISIINGSEVRGRISFQGFGGAAQIFSNVAGPLSVDVKSEVSLKGGFAFAFAEEGSYLEICGKVTEVLVTGKAKVVICKEAEVDTIMLYERSAGSIIEVEGAVGTIRTQAEDAAISAGRSSKIVLIETKAEANGTDIFLNRHAEVNRIDNAASITVSGSGSPGLIAGTGSATYTYSETYKNSQYGFGFALPYSWKGYSIVYGEWLGSYITDTGSNSPKSGPIINIRHPGWTEEIPRQDIPIMVFTLADWDALQREQFHIGAAPVGPSELAHNSKFVFALPARYNFAFLEGHEEVERILKSDPLQVTSHNF